MNKANTTIAKYVLAVSFCLFPLFAMSKSAGHGIILYTPYTSRSVTPGKSLSYNIEVINKTNEVQDVRFSLEGVARNWNPSFAAEANTIQEISVKPKNLGSDSESFDFDLTVPFKIKKGRYHFKLIAKTESGLEYILPLNVVVTKKGVFQTQLKVSQANMQGYANSHFSFDMNVINRTGQKQNYALIADAPPGWDARFMVSGDYVTSITLSATKSKMVIIKVTPPPNVKASTYKIPIHATSGNTSSKVTLETVIEGKYGLDLTTPTGRLSANVTAGGKKDIKLLLKNTGTLPLRNIKLTASTPDEWNVKFDSKEIDQLNPGESTTVIATVDASNKAIAGDYQLEIDANATNVSSKAVFRMSVSETYTWGFIGVLIILVVIGGIGYLFKKYGRR